MTVLVREAFKKEVTVPCLFVNASCIHKAKDYLKNYLLKLQLFKPLQSVNDFLNILGDSNSKDIVSNLPDKDSVKVFVLNPLKISSYSDLQESHREELKKLGVNEDNFQFVLMKICYENWKADEILRAIVPKNLDSVSGYSIIGHILHLNLREELSDFKSIIGQVLLDKVKTARSVVNKVDSIDSTYRNFKMEVLCGDTNMVATVKENRCTFQFDFSTVYWNPRLSTEHERIVQKIKKGDVLYDVFAGVGPFAVPAGAKGCTVLANDLNPESCKWLKKNAKLNKVDSMINVFNHDGTDFIQDVLKAHLLNLQLDKNSQIHITMNLPALAYTFLKHFKGLFSSDEISIFRQLPVPVVYLYCFSKGVEDPALTARSLVEKELDLNLDDEINEIFFVRNVAPNKEMMRVTILLSEKIVGPGIDKRPVLSGRFLKMVKPKKNPFKVSHVRSIKLKNKAKAYVTQLKKVNYLFNMEIKNAISTGLFS
ncbi:hypothetical protein AAG570_013611 [Ranatra chinensis]|uniref:tRNA (guanine(37)-N1)-methyltransferase n=1 Tax=Ranatra chinensis TaxID=642074 RepID=A0ABD0YCP9_9HEMI